MRDSGKCDHRVWLEDCLSQLHDTPAAPSPLGSSAEPGLRRVISRYFQVWKGRGGKGSKGHLGALSHLGNTPQQVYPPALILYRLVLAAKFMLGSGSIYFIVIFVPGEGSSCLSLSISNS